MGVMQCGQLVLEIPGEQSCAAASAAVDSEHVTIDADLKAIVDRWASLPDEFKAGVVAMVRAVGDQALQTCESGHQLDVAPAGLLEDGDPQTGL